ncbi:MAG TPA: glycerol-3-phosphate 1-O-acyltransferase [Nitrospirae bacterium]|nr:glycerol-3-phosphate 1-O-acyltransferase [Nitrospirota bacterium]HDZ88701.1 glycerol-3-phosphate 1-O-acyltransferase [Nitrospirota bacterium]
MLMLLAISAFLTGSIPVGLIVARSKGIDIRTKGSGNIGATNILRNIGKKEALITLIGDISKGVIPVLVAWKFFPDDTRVGIIGLSAIAGHDFSIFLKFRGGKGVATSLGVLLAYSPFAALATAAIWIIVLVISKISSLSAILAFLLLPLTIFIIDNTEGKFLISLIIAALIIIKHKDNIKRLINGEESRMVRKS